MTGLWAIAAVAMGLGLSGALAVALFRKGRSETAARAYLLGVNYVLSGDPDAAIAELSRAAELTPQTLETYFALGALFRRKGDVERALRLHQNMLLRQNLPPQARRRAQLAVATDFRRAGLTGRAVEVLERLLAEAPDHVDGRLALRRLYEELGAFEKAAALQAPWVEADRPGARAVLAHHLAALSRSAPDPSDAVALAERGVALWPESADALLARGEASLRGGDRDVAAQSFRRAFELEPELAPRHLDTFVEGVGVEAAEVDLNRWAAREDGKGAPFVLAAARCRKRTGDLVGAIDRLKGVLEERPRFREARTELGSLLLQLDRSDELRADYAEILGTWGQAPLEFICSACTQKIPEHRFRCPACGEWDTIVREEGGRTSPGPPVSPRI